MKKPRKGATPPATDEPGRAAGAPGGSEGARSTSPSDTTARPVPEGREDALALVEVLQGFAGPLPAPEILAAYDEVLPGLAERIVRLTEREQQHRHELEKGELAFLQQRAHAEATRLSVGQWAGLGLACVLVMAGILFGYLGNHVAMGLVLLPALFEAIGRLVRASRRRRKEDAR